MVFQLIIIMDDEYTLKFCYHCNDTDRLQLCQSGSEIFHNSINTTKQQDHDLHIKLHAELEVDPNY